MRDYLLTRAVLPFVVLVAIPGVAGKACARQAPAPEAPPPTPASATERPAVSLETTMGRFTIALNREKAPVTVDNFLSYVRSGHYDGTVFHRVIPGFMVQGGGFDAQLRQKQVRAPIKNESGNGLSNRRGTLAMARTNDPDSASAQFFINVVDNPRLDGQPGAVGYAVFGEVVEGMDVVDRIVAVETTSRGPYQDVPVTPVVLTTARILSTAAAASPVPPGGGLSTPSPR